MNLNQITNLKNQAWKKFILLQQEIFLISYKDFLDNFNEKLDHSNNEITAIFFLKCYVENFELILINLWKSQSEITSEIENSKKIIISSKDNIEILKMSKNFVKDIKKLNFNFQSLILSSFFITSLPFIKDFQEQEKIIDEFTNQKINFTFEDKKIRKESYKFLEKAWKNNINQIYDEMIDLENQKTRSEIEKSAFISFNLFNNLIN